MNPHAVGVSNSEAAITTLGPKGRSILRTLSHNADFILIAREGDTTTLGLKGRQT